MPTPAQSTYAFDQVCVVSIRCCVFIMTDFESQRDQIQEDGGRGDAKGARGCGREHGKGWGSEKEKRVRESGVNDLQMQMDAAKVKCVDIG